MGDVEGEKNKQKSWWQTQTAESDFAVKHFSLQLDLVSPAPFLNFFIYLLMYYYSRRVVKQAKQEMEGTQQEESSK